MNFPSAGRLGLLPMARTGIRVPPEWVADHVVLVEVDPQDVDLDDDDEGAFEVIFEADFEIDGGDDAAGTKHAVSLSEEILMLLDEEEDEEEEEGGWPS